MDNPSEFAVNRAERGVPRAWLVEHVDYEGDECLIWPFGKNSDGYGQLRYDGRMQLAHRLMCRLVHGPAPTPDHEAAHNCGRGHDACIHPGHLRWDTPKGNQADRIAHGTHARGERSHRAKITESIARQILALKGTMLQREIAAMFDVSRQLVGDIQAKRRWSWL